MLQLLATTPVKLGSSHLKVRKVFLPRPELSAVTFIIKDTKILEIKIGGKDKDFSEVQTNANPSPTSTTGMTSELFPFFFPMNANYLLFTAVSPVCVAMNDASHMYNVGVHPSCII